jgi:Xaa-Pro aminopeptidase
MDSRGLQALVLTAPETLRWATGAFPGVATFWRRAGAAFLVVSVNPDEPLIAIVGDLQAAEFASLSGITDVRSHPLWVETADYDAATAEEQNPLAAIQPSRARDAPPRPGTVDVSGAFALLADALSERGLNRGRIGLEMGFVPVVDYPLFGKAVRQADWRDATDLIARLRAIKHPTEIARLGAAARQSLGGLAALLGALRPGLDAKDMTAIWREGARAAARDLDLPTAGGDWAYIAVGGDGFSPGEAARVGDLVKIDVGCVVDGYSSDGGRTAVIGQPSAVQGAVYDALRAGFDAGLELLKPGVRLSEIHAAVSNAIRARGLGHYSRGHFGHGVGAGIWSEEWPFLSADSTALAEPGMVLAFETPYYIRGLGGFIIEDQFLIGEHGVEVMGEAPRELFIAPA